MQEMPISDIVTYLETDLKEVMNILSKPEVFEVMLNPFELQTGDYEGHLWYEADGVGMKRLMTIDKQEINYPKPQIGDMVLIKVIDDSKIINYHILPKDRTFFKAIKLCLIYALANDSDGICYLDQVEMYKLIEFASYIESGFYGYKDPIANDTTINQLLFKINNDYLKQLNISFQLDIIEANEELIADLTVPKYSITKSFLKLDYTRAEQIIGILASANEKKAHKYEPIVEVQIPFYGHRFTGVLPPVAKFPLFAIRKHSSRVRKIEEYVESGVMPAEAADIIITWIKRHYNFLIGGAVGSGKTSLLNTCLDLSSVYTPNDRLGILEDTPEIQNVVENAYALATADGVPYSRIFRTALRLSSVRLVAGEIRGAEAYVFLKAMSGGFKGCIGTIHAEGAAHAMYRMEQCISENEEVGKVTPAHRVQIGSSIHGIISIQKVTLLKNVNGVNEAIIKRRVTAIRRIKGYDPKYDLYDDSWLYKDPECFMLTTDGADVNTKSDFAEFSVSEK